MHLSYCLAHPQISSTPRFLTHPLKSGECAKNLGGVLSNLDYLCAVHKHGLCSITCALHLIFSIFVGLTFLLSYHPCQHLFIFQIHFKLIKFGFFINLLLLGSYNLNKTLKKKLFHLVFSNQQKKKLCLFFYNRPYGNLFHMIIKSFQKMKVKLINYF
jgi:hypothetical protein